MLVSNFGGPTNGTLQRPLIGGWRWVRLGEVCQLVGTPINPQQYADETFAHYSIPAYDARRGADLQRGSLILSTKLLFPRGAILFSKLNPRISRVWLVRDALSARRICSTEFLPLVPDTGTVDSDFLALALQAPDLMAGLRARVAAATKSRERLTPTLVLNAQLPLPPLVEQRRIAAMLTEQIAMVERARAAAEARVEAALFLRNAYLESAFNEIVRDSCPVNKVGEIAQVAGGIQKSPERAPRQFHRPFLTVRNVQRGSLDLSKVQRFEVTPDELERLRLQIGDLLIVEGNGSRDHIGRNAIFDIPGEEWIHQNHVIRVRLSPEMAHPEFVSLYLNSPQGAAQLLEKARTTSGLYTLSVGKVSSLVVPVPPLEQQISMTTKLRSHVSTSDRCRLSAESELAVIVALPAALLRRAFQGS